MRMWNRRWPESWRESRGSIILGRISGGPSIFLWWLSCALDLSMSVWGCSWHISRSSPHGTCQEVEGNNIGSSGRESFLETQEATSRAKLSVTSTSIGTWSECRLQLSSWLLEIFFDLFSDCVFYSRHLMITRGNITTFLQESIQGLEYRGQSLAKKIYPLLLPLGTLTFLWGLIIPSSIKTVI